MKNEILIFLMVIIKIFANDCTTYPPGLKTIEECCNVPQIIDNEALYNCSLNCQNSSCISKCYLDSTHIFDHGKLNKAAILARISNYGPNSIWEEIIKNSLDKCENLLNSESQLVDFYSCIKKEASKDCPEYQAIMGCSSVEKYVEDCRQKAHDCSKWPKKFNINTIITCCNTPDLVSHAERSECSAKCIFSNNPYNCSEVCALNWEKFVKDGKFDNQEVVKALNKNRNQSVPWEKPIDDAVEGCVKSLKEIYRIEVFNSVNSLRALSFCLQEHLSANCVGFNDIGAATGCYGYIKYKIACPETKPAKKWY